MIVKSLTKKYRRFQTLFKENWRLASALLLFSILPLLFSSVLTGWLMDHHKQVEQWLAVTGAWPVLAFGVTMAVGLTPTTFVALICGFFLGFAGIGYVVIAYTLASIAGYGLGRYLDGGRFLESLQRYPLAEKVATDLSLRPVGMLALMRLSPALPFCLTNLLLAALRVRLDLYVLAGALGMLPRTLLSLWLGSQSRTLLTLFESSARPLDIVWLAGGTVLTIVLLAWMVSERMKRAVIHNTPR